MLVQNSLGIVWMGSDGCCDELPGIYFYGYFGSGKPSNDIELLKSLWSSISGGVQWKLIEAEKYNVFECDVRFDRWPGDNDWRKAIEGSLRTIVKAGASVAWCGGEECNWVPEVLDPESKAGDVYAGYAEPAGLLCNALGIADERVNLSDDQLLLLYRELRRM